MQAVKIRPSMTGSESTNWTELASTDPVWIDMWDMENPDYNGAACAFAKLDGVWFLDLDDLASSSGSRMKPGRRCR
jgi:hypothetical protein